MRKLLSVIALFALCSIAQGAELTCFGTEPFWGAEISRNKISINDFDKTITEKVHHKRSAAGTTEGYNDVYQTRNMTVVTKLTNNCNDGMSDNIFEYDVTLITKTKVLTGCCTKKH